MEGIVIKKFVPEIGLAKVQPYYKKELAGLYDISRRYFMQTWIYQDKLILNKLKVANYDSVQKQFTVKQVEIIFAEFGQPEAKLNSMVQKTIQKAQIRPYTKGELADMYNWSIKTLISHLHLIDRSVFYDIFTKSNYKGHKEISIDKKTFSKKQVKTIFSSIGQPYL